MTEKEIADEQRKALRECKNMLVNIGIGWHISPEYLARVIARARNALRLKPTNQPGPGAER